MRRGRVVRGLAIVLLVLLSTALSLLAAEWLARRWGIESQFGRLIPLREIPTRSVGGVLLWSADAPRYSGLDLQRAATADAAFKILGLGDSIMYGVGLERTDTYLEQARARLARKIRRPIEVLNLAVPGFNTRQENAVYAELGGYVRPDLVLLHYWADDARQYRMAGGYVIDYGDISADGRLLVRALPLPADLSDYLLIHSRLYGLLTEVVVRHRRAGAETDWRNVSEPLVAIDQRARRAGARLLVLASADLAGETPRPTYDLPLLRDLARQRGFEVVDLSEWVKGIPSVQIAMDACHFNAEGHRILGEHLASYLLAHDLRAEAPSDADPPRD